MKTFFRFNNETKEAFFLYHANASRGTGSIPSGWTLASVNGSIPRRRVDNRYWISNKLRLRPPAPSSTNQVKADNTRASVVYDRAMKALHYNRWHFESEFTVAASRRAAALRLSQQAVFATQKWIYMSSAMLFAIINKQTGATWTDAVREAAIRHVEEQLSNPKIIFEWYEDMKGNAVARVAYAGYSITSGSSAYSDLLTAAGAPRKINGDHQVIIGSIPTNFKLEV